MAINSVPEAFESAALLADAERRTALHDWGGEAYFEESFRKLLVALSTAVCTEANLTPTGLQGAHLRLRDMVEYRLRFIDDRKKWPAIAKESIDKPIVILGLPRAGSTFLHSLMGQDSANRNPQTWEMLYPSPPPDSATYDSDARIDRAQALLRAMGAEEADVVTLHPFGARQPEECHLLMELMGLGDNLPAFWRVPSFNRVRNAVDLREGYRLHRMALQNLQYRHRGERWVLKNPGHVFYLDHLLAVYPDVKIIQAHRDPTKVIPSITALLVAMRRANSDAPIPADKIAQGNLRAFASGLEKAIEFRQRPGMESHFHDVHFRQLIDDPMGTIRDVYRRFDMVLSAETEERMRRWLRTGQGHAARTRFTLAEFGLNAAQIESSFQRYIEHHKIQRERE